LANCKYLWVGTSIFLSFCYKSFHWEFKCYIQCNKRESCPWEIAVIRMKLAYLFSIG